MDKRELLKLAEIEDKLADKVLIGGGFCPQEGKHGSDLLPAAYMCRHRAIALRALAKEDS